MMKFLCPACGADCVFKSSLSVFAVCAYCHSTVVRHDLNFATLGKMADLPADMSPFQIGTCGSYQKKEFEIIGRLKIGWTNGVWNEWYIQFKDGRNGWLAEAQGNLMVSFEDDTFKDFPDPAAITPGYLLPPIDQEIFRVDDIKHATCIGSEGELPMPAMKGRQTLSIDISGPNLKFGTLEYSGEGDGKRLYLGRFVEFDQMYFKNLRELDGW